MVMFIFVFEDDEPINAVSDVDGRTVCHETQPTYVINANTREEAIAKLIPLRPNGSDDPEDYKFDIAAGSIGMHVSDRLVE